MTDDDGGPDMRTRRPWSRRRALGALLGCALVVAASPAEAEDLDGLVRRADRILRGSSSAAVMRMEIKTKRFQRTYTMVLWDDSSGRADKTLVKILGPTSWRGFATLKVGNRLKFYDPKTNHVQTVGHSMLGDSWMGSHFSNDDLVKETQLAQHYRPHLVRKHAGRNELGQQATLYRIDLTPKPTAPVVWGRIAFQLWQRGDVVLPTQSEYYRKKGDEKPVRTLRFFDVREMGGRLVPAQMEVRVTDKPGEYTRITYEKLRFDVKIPPSKFTEQAMH
jgi:hypothetical protein